MKVFLKLIVMLTILLVTFILIVYGVSKLNLFPNRQERAKQILNSIPIYNNSKLVNESQPGFPDGTPSIIREYESNISGDKLMEFYKSSLTEQGWVLKIYDTKDKYVPKEILANKDGWKIDILIYSSGKYLITIYLH